jgi:UDP-N-acetylmuramoylalanine--D-glutamate ligase
VTLDQLCARRVAVWGTGTEGLAMARLLAGHGVIPVMLDDEGAAAADRVAPVLGAGTVVHPPAEVDWGAVDVVVRSPGVARSRPELTGAEASGVLVTTAMAVWLEDVRDAPVLAVTGTKGKSTTATLAAAILRHQGLDVALVGNIGTPVTDSYDRPVPDAYVVEVSSYQAVDVTVTPRVCVLTSLAPDHLDWHGGEEAYYRDKLRLVTAGPPGELAVNAASPEALARTAGHPHRTLFGPTGRVVAGPDGTVTVDGAPVADAPRLRVPGAHNVVNLCGAVAGATLLLGEPPRPGAVDAAVDAYDGLPSRCRTVGTRDGVEFVDDALASNPFATTASLGAFPGRELTVIVGGADRGTDPTDLLAALGDRRPSPRAVVLDGATDGAARALRSPGSPVESVGAADLRSAVAAAVAVTPAGGVVLFSPAAPTPAGGGGYAARSREFASAAGLGETGGEPGPS